MDAYGDGCPAISISTAHPTRTSNDRAGYWHLRRRRHFQRIRAFPPGGRACRPYDRDFLPAAMRARFRGLPVDVPGDPASVDLRKNLASQAFTY